MPTISEASKKMRKFLFPLLIIGFLGVSSAATYDLDSLYYNNELNISNTAGEHYGFSWNNDGSKFYVIEDWSNDNRIFEYTLSDAYNISTASYNQVLSLDGNEYRYFDDITWNNDGSKMYLVGDESDGSQQAFQFDLSTNYDISTASFTAQTTVIPENDDSDMTSITWSGDGELLHLLGADGSNIWQYNASDPYNISSIDQGDAVFSTSGQTSDPQSMVWNSDGSKLFIGGDNQVFQYSVSSNYDASTTVYSKSLNLGSRTPNFFDPSGIGWNNTGGKLYASDEGMIYEYGQNAPPNLPSLVNPNDGSNNIATSPTLQVDVSDDNSDSMDVSFYDASDNSLLDTDTDVASGSTAEYTWNSLDYGTSYSWYAVADDGSSTTQSSTWSFTTTHIEDVSNTAAHTGSWWIEGSAMWWVSSDVERILRNINVVDASSSGPVGSVWIEGDSIHLINENSEELSYSGPVIDASTAAPNGYTWIENDLIHYVDTNGDERVINGE